MKKYIWNLFGVALMALVIGFSLVQLSTRVVKAEGCPPASAVGCGCMSQGHTGINIGDGLGILWTCNYLCGGCGGDGNPMYIETIVEVMEWF